MNHINHAPIDPICQRIHIRRPGGFYSTPDWTFAQLERLKTISPTLKMKIMELRQDQNSDWLIVPEDRVGVDHGAIIQVFDLLGTAETNVNARAQDLSKYCNALWHLHVIPARFPECRQWRASEDNGDNRGAPEGDWCWRYSVHDGSPGTHETALRLANIALILGNEAMFEREIKTVIWDWKEGRAIVPTPVRQLQFGGPDGLNDRRAKEKLLIIDRMHRYLDRRRNSGHFDVKQTERELQDQGMVLHEPDQFPQSSIYKMLDDIEHIILRPRRASGSQQSIYGAHPRHRGGGGGWVARIRALEERLEAWLSGGDSHREFVRGMLDDANSYIASRQKEVAKNMFQARKDELAMWEWDML
ncbi:hypothetical protein B0T19DRAFT_405978 [Cercophora scortea]|uniref:Uncharacterized protein n=1 Tax=Cercophora scortea TaxID=314031 RepID=A0AAE0J1N9_9PEZI|nr:hypothetical protein B0T19DRAFT_405978 [Cercophora scortea]